MAEAIKKVKKGSQYRKRRRDSSPAEEEPCGSEVSSGEDDEKRLKSTLADIKDIQKMRTRTGGLSHEELAFGKDLPKIATTSGLDPLKLRTGGMIDLRKIRQSEIDESNIEDDIKQTFSKESRLRDEDEEMRKYVEEQIVRSKGGGEAEGGEKKGEEDAMFQLPERLKKYQSKKNEEMLSNQMLCGIPEVDLGIEAKIKNIEETESAKLRLLKETVQRKRNLAEATTFKQDLVKDLSKNYVQHSIYHISETTDIGSGAEKKLERPPTDAVPVVGEETPQWMLDGRKVPKPQHLTEKTEKRPAKATDKKVYDKFKQKMNETK